jgi:hypothetical protein
VHQIAGLRSVRRYDHVHGAAIAQMQRHKSAATDDFVVRMRGQDQEALAA